MVKRKSKTVVRDAKKTVEKRRKDGSLKKRVTTTKTPTRKTRDVQKQNKAGDKVTVKTKTKTPTVFKKTKAKLSNSKVVKYKETKRKRFGRTKDEKTGRRTDYTDATADKKGRPTGKGGGLRGYTRPTTGKRANK